MPVLSIFFASIPDITNLLMAFSENEEVNAFKEVSSVTLLTRGAFTIAATLLSPVVHVKVSSSSSACP